MFSSVCSLRSAQCATLIALAAAAGISRFEPTTITDAAPEPQTTTQVLVETGLISRAYFYLAAMRAITSRIHLPATSFAFVHDDGAAHSQELSAIAPAETWPPAPAAVDATENFFTRVAAFPTARDRAYPYAVGPPLHRIQKSLRAAGNVLPAIHPHVATRFRESPVFQFPFCARL